MRISYASKAIKQLDALPSHIAKRIIDKMDWYVAQKDPLSFAVPIKDIRFGTFRFRVGRYRVLCDVKNGKVTILHVLTIVNRKDAYR